MTDETRKALSELWQRNEKAIQEAESLKVGPESPIDRAEKLDGEQDEIESDLGTDYIQRRRMELDGEGS
jgi:hypothetical protein